MIGASTQPPSLRRGRLLLMLQLLLAGYGVWSGVSSNRPADGSVNRLN